MMMIDGIDFENLPAEKYWQFSKTYKGDKKAEIKNMFLSGNYLASLKNDGHYARFIKDMDGNMRLQGRSESVNGGYLNKIEWVPQCKEFFDSLPNGTCLLGELYFPKQRGSRKVTTILGCLKEKALNRQENGEKLSYYIFDVWAWGGKSLLNTPYETRIRKFLDTKVTELVKNSECVETAICYEGQEAWDKLGEYLSQGLEGMVLYKKNGIAEPNKKTARKTLKVKMEIENHIDVFIDGNYSKPKREYTGKEIENWNYWESEKTGEKVNKNMFFEYTKGEPWTPVKKTYFYGWAGSVSISIMKDGKPYHLGYISGVTDEMKKGIVENPDKYINQVWEVSAMEIEKIDGHYSLRHGNFVQPRPDKKAVECTFDQIA